ncbi:hypothetical protein I7V34_21420 [Bacillus sp. V3]|uniref:hypothetical protein n=1 Tax=[Bacillus] enclensis TaxID=1402860 RepID=UPI000509AA22|nr:hypothetical protein [[Bacillus] enclensis]MBH9966205.1 hypothetical protein [[Bacillus] enclensis]QTC41570.1 hypothetical protein I7V34_21420 [Bacillus sp. V3]
MNARQKDKHQRLRIAQSLYRKKKHRNSNKDKESKVWTLFMVLSVLLALIILTITELYHIDGGVSLPGFIRKAAEMITHIF